MGKTTKTLYKILRFLGHQNWIRYGIRNRILRFFCPPDTIDSYKFEILLNGFKYKGNLNIYLDWVVYFYGGYEKSELCLLKDLVKGERDSIFVDVGANIGQHSIYMSKYCKEVHSFEPYDKVSVKLEEKINLNNITNITLHKVALGDQSKDHEFFAPIGANSGTGSFVREHERDNNESIGKLKIVNGDEYFDSSGIRKVSILKIDVEGYEKYVLRGLKKIINKNRPTIMMEISETNKKSFSNNYKELVNLLPSNYLIKKILSNRPRLILFNSPKYSLVNFDFKIANGNLIFYPEETLNRALTRTSRQTNRPVYAFRTGQLGDAVVALPALNYIATRHHGSKIRIITNKKISPDHVGVDSVYKNENWYSGIYSYKVGSIQSARGLASKIRKNGGGTVYLLLSSEKPIKLIRDWFFFRFCCRCKVVGANFRLILKRSPKKYRQDAGIGNRVSDQLLNMVGGQAELQEDIGGGMLAVPESAKSKSKKLLSVLPVGNPIIAMGPGTKMPSKQWPIDRYVKLIERIRNSNPEALWVIMGGHSEIDLLSPVGLAVQERGLNLVGKTTITESAAILANCDFYLGNDTGTMHLAAAMGLPCVAIFSARDTKGQWAPIGIGHLILETSPSCRGCMLIECVENDNKCLNDISITQVKSAVDKMIHTISK